MTKLLHLMTVVMLCLSEIATAQQTQEARSAFCLEVAIYPREIYFGDPIYIGIYRKNISEEMATSIINNGSRHNHWLTLHSEGISVPYFLLYESDVTWYPGSSNHPPASLYHTFQPGESMLVTVAYQELPALEDMNFPFWEEAKKRLNVGENVVVYITGEIPERTAAGRNARERIVVQPAVTLFISDPIVIKPRPGSEMELLEKWLEETPKRLLPVPYDQFNAESDVGYWDAWRFIKDEFDTIPFTPKPDFVSKTRDYKVKRNDRHFLASNERFIKVRDKEYFPYFFLRHGNRKPGDPVCPETWQGWKELEESLSPSTMRDEIRMVRILIQYCDTEDEAVLQELKDWFADMNELQRTVMANLTQCNNPATGLSHVREVGKAIQKYAVLPVRKVTPNTSETQD